MVRPLKPAGPPPAASTLRDAAMRHLSRFAVTQVGLERVLDRRIQRWAARARGEGRAVEADVGAARRAAREVAAGLVQAGVVDDAAFAAARARRLNRAGRSRRAAAAHLAAKGVGAELADSVLAAEEDELPAALAYARRRRIGPFRVAAGEEGDRLRDLASLGRAGFPRSVAHRALDLDAEAAEAIVLTLRRG